jgi:hypothetical protein
MFREVQKGQSTALSLWAKDDIRAAWTSGLDRTLAPGSSHGPPHSPSFSQHYRHRIIHITSHVIQGDPDCPELALVTAFTSIPATQDNDQKQFNIIKKTDRIHSPDALGHLEHNHFLVQSFQNAMTVSSSKGSGVARPLPQTSAHF